ncbi:MAG TPA: hypothetical protein PKX39_10870, partial [Flavobacteriales bacterium]|nr:hypothetical protein [Flavobacteriales bacterium]
NDELAIAERLAERAVDLLDDFTFRDTWATLAFRRGDVVRAVELQLEAITDERAARRNAGPAAKPSDVLLVSQLARFLAERQR